MVSDLPVYHHELREVANYKVICSKKENSDRISMMPFYHFIGDRFWALMTRASPFKARGMK
ncbi:hypothetical protein [Hyella patelloides]|uniref:hypothetical protein n=1 Tax=Hyella patelloides TaxID=1982969 RepID=UPI00119CAEDE|nr:hypothetical protein [Hyella patelloides]